MKRRGFIGLLAAGILLPLRSLAQAFCNPALVQLFEQGRKLVQARPGKTPSLGDYFIQWYGHSSFLIHSGSQTKVVADPNFNVTPGIQADAVTVSNDHFTHNNTGAVSGNPVILRNHFSPDVESDTDERKRHYHREHSEPEGSGLGRGCQFHFHL